MKTAEQEREESEEKATRGRLKTSQNLDKLLKEMNESLDGRLEQDIPLGDSFWQKRQAYQTAYAAAGQSHITEAEHELNEARLAEKKSAAKNALDKLGADDLVYDAKGMPIGKVKDLRKEMEPKTEEELEKVRELKAKEEEKARRDSLGEENVQSSIQDTKTGAEQLRELGL